MADEQQQGEKSLSSISDEKLFEVEALKLRQISNRTSQTSSSIAENNIPIGVTNSTSSVTVQKSIDSKAEMQSDSVLSSISLRDVLSSTMPDQHSSISSADSPILEGQEINGRNQTLSDITNSLNRKISLSESDLLSSLHRNITKQTTDNQSENDTTDDILFLEWDKERNLFQDYVNSLRKEIRVLLQERLDNQTQNPTQYNHVNDDHNKVDLLLKSLEEKNFVIEQLQTDYELVKEKNTNSLRKISLLESDNKTYLNIIDELKQNLSDLTVDLQNQILIKRRLEISINNLESNCQLIDVERIKLINDIKENQHSKQELETLLQKSNVTIAEQGNLFNYKISKE